MAQRQTTGSKHAVVALYIVTFSTLVVVMVHACTNQLGVEWAHYHRGILLAGNGVMTTSAGILLL